MATSSRYSKGGSSAFLKTLKTSRRSDRRGGVSELVPVMTFLQDGPRKVEEIAERFPFAEKMIYSLVMDKMVERLSDEKGATIIKLTNRGEDFLKHRALYTSAP